MARISGTTALRAALGGVAGGLKGLGAMREEQRLLAQQDEARKRQAMLDARQAAMDQVGLFNQGFMTGEETAGERQRTGAALSRALSSATAMMAPGAGMGGAMPSLQQGDVRRAAAAPGFESPQQRVTMGGVAYQREAPFAKAAREAEQELAKQRMADEATQATQRQTREVQKRALVGMGLSADQAEAALSMGAKYSDIAETPADRQRRLMDERRLGLEARRLSLAERAATAPRAGTVEPATGAMTFSDAANYLGSLTEGAVKNLSAKGVWGANLAQTAGGASGGATDVVGTLTGAIGQPEREYLEYAGSVADAWARKSEVGVLTNQDINRYRNLVVFQAGDTDADKWRKVQRAQKWAAALAQMGDAPDAQIGGQSEQNRFDQLVQRGMDSTGAASLVQRETQGAGFGLPNGSRPSLSSIFGR